MVTDPLIDGGFELDIRNPNSRIRKEVYKPNWVIVPLSQSQHIYLHHEKLFQGEEWQKQDREEKFIL